MKSLFLLISAILLNGTAAWAGSIAYSPDSRDLQVTLSWTKDQAVLQVVSPLGYDQLPQLEGPVSAGMLPFLKTQTDELSGLGDRFKIQWSRNRCALTEDDPWVLSCGPGTVEGNVGAIVTSLTGSLETERRSSGKQERWKLRIGFARGRATYFVTIELPKELCLKN